MNGDDAGNGIEGGQRADFGIKGECGRREGWSAVLGIIDGL